MLESESRQRKAVGKLLVLAALMALGWVCIRTLRFTDDGLNLAFACAFLLIPFLAIPSVLRLRRWPRVVAIIIVAPLAALSSLFLLIVVSCDIPAVVQKRQLSRELCTLQQGAYSVHLLWEETAGGALGPHGLGLEQRMIILPGLYLVKNVAYFEGASAGSLSAEGADKVRLHIPKSTMHEEVDRVYSLKPRVYF
ncbi:MAG: hypothetical protein ACRD3N_09260 [Terracidiphilus sp.]